MAVSSNTGRHFCLQHVPLWLYDNVIAKGLNPMTERATKPVTVTLGGMAASAKAHVASGRYASISEVVRAGLRALDREEADLASVLRKRVAKIQAFPEAVVPIEAAFSDARLRLEQKWASDDA